MPSYKVQNQYIKHGIRDNAEDKIEETLQPILDGGTSMGWVLHSCHVTAAPQGTNVVFIWQLPD